MRAVATGFGTAAAAADPRPHLASPKSIKFMSKQDRMAVVAAADAVRAAGGIPAGDRTGVYLAVGFIPFESAALDPLAAASTGPDGTFSMAAFSTGGLDAVHPLLTFQCLPNMPLHHVAANLGARGPYAVSYPGPAQFYLMLDRAVADLAAGVVDAALVGGVADQENFLVRYHFGRLPGARGRRLLDGAAFAVVVREADAAGRGLALDRLEIAYGVSPDPATPFGRERLDDDEPEEAYHGAAGPGLTLAAAPPGRALVHRLRTADGYGIEAAWSPA